MIYQVIKRDGTDVPFEASKIEDAVYKAAVACAIKDEAARSVAGDVCNKVTDHLELVRADKADIESIQDLVESSLIELGYGSVAKAYILYRQKRTDARESRSHIMKTMFDLPFVTPLKATTSARTPTSTPTVLWVPCSSTVAR